MKKLLLFISIMMSASIMIAQPLNDSCVNAIKILNLDNNCQYFVFEDANVDLRNGACAADDYSNIWFTFDALSTDLSISVNNPLGGATPIITLYQFTANPCELQGATEIQCSPDSMNLTNQLVIGNTYYFNVSFAIEQETSIEVCIDNYDVNTVPQNDFTCNAQEESFDNNCFLVETRGATFDTDNPFCFDQKSNSVWFSGRVPSRNDRLVVRLDDIQNVETSIMIGTFTEDNCFDEFIPIDGGCLNGADEIEFTDLQPGREYHIMLAHDDADAERFQVCLDVLGPINPCRVNQECSTSQVIPIVTGEDAVCVQGCNFGASEGLSGITSNPCANMNTPTVWYTFTTDELAQRIDLNYSSTELTLPHVALFEAAPGCDDLTPVYCTVDIPRDRFVTDVEPFTTYYLAITDAGGRTGDFEFCVRTFSRFFGCNIKDTLYVTETTQGSAFTGPFKTGEFVTFRYEIEGWYSDACNFISGIVPTFGSGWDQSLFSSNGQPQTLRTIRPVSNGTWRWYPFGKIRYNFDDAFSGLRKNQPLGAGWYFYQDSVLSRDPNESRGDGFNCDTDTFGTWALEFRLRARPNTTCNEGFLFDGTVAINTFTDGQVGSHNRRGCYLDGFATITSNIICCKGPSFTPPVTQVRLCEGDTASIDFSNLPDVDRVAWTIIRNEGLRDIPIGEGTEFNQTFEIEGNLSFGEVILGFTAIDEQGCAGETEQITITVYRKLEVDAGTDRTACEGEEVILGGNPTASGGQGNYNYVWLNANNVANPTIITPSIATDYIVIVVDDFANCENRDTVRITPTPAPFASIQPINDICVGQDARLNIELNGTPPFNWEVSAGNVLNEQFTNYNLNSYQRNITIPGNFDIDVLLRGDAVCDINRTFSQSVVADPAPEGDLSVELCSGESFTLGGNTFDRRGNYRVSLRQASAEGCDSIVNLDLDIFTPIVIQEEEIGQDGNGGFFIKVVLAGGNPPYQFNWSNGVTGTDSIGGLASGNYSLDVIDDNNCTRTFNFMVTTNTAEAWLSAYNIFPNPARINQDILIAANTARLNEIKSYAWIDLTGKVLEEQKINGSSNSIPGLNVPGMYILKLYNAEGKIIGMKKVSFLD